GDAGIKRGDVLERVSACRQRRIAVEPILKDEAADLPTPIVMSAQATAGIFPEISSSIRFGRALEGLQLGELGGFLGRIVCKRRRRPELACRGQYPGIQHRHLRQNWVRTVPFAGSSWQADGPLSTGGV